MHNEFSSTTF